MTVRLPFANRSVSSSTRCSTSASGVPTRIVKTPSGPAPGAAGPPAGSTRAKVTERSVTLGGRLAASMTAPRASTTARSTTFSSSRTFPGQRYASRQPSASSVKPSSTRLFLAA